MSTTAELSKKAEILIEALPYIRRFEGQTVVIKYGGSLMFDQDAKRRFCANIVLLRYVGMNPVVVHGGGKEISKWLERVGKRTEFIDGLRVTDQETMEITEMVLSGKVNSDIVSTINQVGGKAVGLSGKDAGLLLAHRRKHPQHDLGFVGEVKSVNGKLLNLLCEGRYIPVVSSIAVGLEGETLNINADEAAGAIAGELDAAKLVFLTDVDGIMKDGALINFLELKDAEALLTDPAVSGGMIPKLQCVVQAIKSGVRSVHIINGSNVHAVLLEIFTDSGVGTMIQHKKSKG